MHAQEPGLGVEGTDLLQRRFAVKDYARFAVQFGPQAKESLDWKLPHIDTGI
jgi:hypothetical protein